MFLEKADHLTRLLFLVDNYFFGNRYFTVF